MSGEIESRRYQYNGVNLRVDIDPDDLAPSFYGVSDNPDDGGYRRADASAFNRGEWRFVMVTVRLADVRDASVVLGGVEWGRAPSWDRDIGMNEVISDHVVPDMIHELINAIRPLQVTLADALEKWKAL